jgi:hypothetical protein
LPELVRRRGADPGLAGGPVQLAAQGVRGDPAALAGEQEVGGLAGAGVRQRAAG